MISKESFLKTIEFIKDQQKLQDELCDVLEKLSPGCFCNAFIYSSYEDMVFDLLQESLNDEEDIIRYRFYDLDNENILEEAVEKYPELASWETVYDYLVNKSKTDN